MQMLLSIHEIAINKYLVTVVLWTQDRQCNKKLKLHKKYLCEYKIVQE